MLTKRSRYDVLAPIVLFVVLYLALEIIIRMFAIPRYVLPSPTQILLSFLSQATTVIIPNLIITLQEIFVGLLFGIPLGIVLAAFMTQFKILDKAFSPFVILLATTPLLTLVPLLMLWLGLGIQIKMIAVAISTFPIVMLNAATGFSNVDDLKLELMKALGASRLQTFFRVILPAASPSVFTGVKLGCIFATTTAIGAEFVGGNVGLGSKILMATSFIQTDIAFACILAVALIGIVLYGLVAFLERRIVTWET